MESMKPMKVVWLCHFSNPEVRERLPLSGLKVRNAIKDILGKENTYYRDFAPWITRLIKEFEKFKDVRLYIISPHVGLKPLSFSFEMHGISYNFFKSDRLLNLVTKRFRTSSDKYQRNRNLILKFVNQIKPDIVNLIGTENPYYAASVIDIENLPIYVSVQTVYNNPQRNIHSHMDGLRSEIEMQIFRKEIYYGCTGRIHRDLIYQYNPQAIFFKMFFPVMRPSISEKEENADNAFDFVFFAATVDKRKGAEDAIEAMAIVKKVEKNVVLNLVGRCDNSYRAYLDKRIRELDLTRNIVFTDYFASHAEMHQHVKQSRFALLPIKLDVIPGTVKEAILLGLPVVTYKTTGTPYLNRDGDAVLLADIGDIDNLAQNMLKLMYSPELAATLRRNAKSFVEKELDNTKSAKRLVANYRAVLEHYHRGTPIPQGQLFDLKEFPVY
jgi:glycosyltransferase involved in cell wall biosynthesis